MGNIRFDYTNALSYIQEHEIAAIEPFVQKAHEMLHKKTGAGNRYLGWVNLPASIQKSEIQHIQQVARKIQAESDALVVIGVGGSYLGARAAIEMLNHSFYNQLSKEKRKTPAVYFAGHHFSPVYLAHLMELLEDVDFSINVISKSGTTTEPAIAFRVVKEYLEKKYGEEEAGKRIYVTTDRQKGALKKMADEKGYESFVIPEDVGGRYSVLTAVGLLPMAVSGVNIEEVVTGARDACRMFGESQLIRNDCYQYAAVRHLLYRKGFTIELLANYDPALHSFSEWWKQLFGESEGKDHKGIFPAAVDYTTDLHSIGQYIQDGLRNIFETVIYVESPKTDFMIKEDQENRDGLNYLAGKTMGDVNKRAFEGAMLAHTDGGVPNLVVGVPEISGYYFGHLVYFFEKACGISGYLLGVNPFDQPGVEAYKKNMFALLGKPGFEREKEILEKRLK